MSKPIKCLLIDDNPSDRTLFKVCLKHIDVPVELTVAETGVDALQRLRTDDSFTPEYIFLDINMPFMDGKECLVELKKIDRLAETEIVICSTSDNPNDIEETRNNGAAKFLTKPYDLDVFTDFIKKIFTHAPLSFHVAQHPLH